MTVLIRLFVIVVASTGPAVVLFAQESPVALPSVKPADKAAAEDEEIRQRLKRILDATGWFQDPQVRVEEGVVFLAGRTHSEQAKRWAGELARNTRDVVAVVNRIEIEAALTWDFRPITSVTCSS